jgi:hypothetical protein
VVERECANAAEGLHAECRIMPATLSEECAINERDALRLCQNASLSFNRDLYDRAKLYLRTIIFLTRTLPSTSRRKR